MSDDSINLALQLTKDGETTKARQLLIRALKQDPDNEQAWFALSEVVEEQEQVIQCLERVLKINPDNTNAQQRLNNLKTLEETAAFNNTTHTTLENASTHSNQPPPSPGSSVGKLIRKVYAGRNLASPTTIISFIGVGLAGIVVGIFIAPMLFPSSLSPMISQMPDTHTPTSTNNLLPTDTPQPALPLPTYTPYPTYTPFPIPPVVSINNPTPSPTIRSIVGPLGTITVNSWRYEITKVLLEPGQNASRKTIVLMGNLTNLGLGRETFTPIFKIVLQDSHGVRYEYEIETTRAAGERYASGSRAYIDPGATSVDVVIAFDVPANERQFQIVAGKMAFNWSGDITFTLPPPE